MPKRKRSKSISPGQRRITEYYSDLNTEIKNFINAFGNSNDERKKEGTIQSFITYLISKYAPNNNVTTVEKNNLTNHIRSFIYQLGNANNEEKEFIIKNFEYYLFHVFFGDSSVNVNHSDILSDGWVMYKHEHYYYMVTRDDVTTPHVFNFNHDSMVAAIANADRDGDHPNLFYLFKENNVNQLEEVLLVNADTTNIYMRPSNIFGGFKKKVKNKTHQKLDNKQTKKSNNKQTKKKKKN